MTVRFDEKEIGMNKRRSLGWMKFPGIFVLLLIVSTYAFSQVPPDKAALLNGDGMGQGEYAEQTGYPGPKHILDLSDKLKLTDSQKQSVQKLYDEMNTRAKELGKQIVRVEQELRDAIAGGLVSEKSIQTDCDDIGRLRGKLRAVHLAAHLKTKSVLTDAQLALYKNLRAASDKK
jgi:Spy/CpxP family protein refolding chaperone